jgi:hypothetical protein
METPRDIYLTACASIGEHLEESFGFKYVKSRPCARKRSGDFTFQVLFQSSHRNIAGKHVNLSLHGHVMSTKIETWRGAQPFLESSDYVAGGQIGNLQTDHHWLDWELANRRKRDKTIRSAIKAIEELALPYFAKFENLPSLFQLLVKEDLPGMTIEHVVEFLMCFTDPPTARLAAANFFHRRPDLIQAYRQSYAHYAEIDLGSEHPSGYAEKLAFASHAFRFGDLTT